MPKIGLYLPIYGGWVRGPHEKEQPPTYSYVREVAQEAERIGIDSLWIPDHLLNPLKGEGSPSLEAWTLAAAIAEATEKVVIVHTTLCEAFRYPAVLAKQAATLTDISRGRFWLSLGAGWFKREYEAYGLPFYEHNQRIDRTREAIQIIRGLWEQESVTFQGKYYSITNGALAPKPEPKPPIWYAGMTEASRNLAAEEAEGWLMNGCGVEEAGKRVADLEERLQKKGRNRIEFAVPALTFIRDTDAEAREFLAQTAGGDAGTLDHTLDSGLVGSPETVARKIRQFEKTGINHVLLQLTPSLAELSQVKKVLAALAS